MSGVRNQLAQLVSRGQTETPEYKILTQRLNLQARSLRDTSENSGVMPGFNYELRPRAYVANSSAIDSRTGADSMMNGTYKSGYDAIGSHVEKFGTNTTLRLSKSDIDNAIKKGTELSLFPKYLLLTLATAKGGYVGVEVTAVRTNPGVVILSLERISTNFKKGDGSPLIRNLTLTIPFSPSEEVKTMVLRPGVSIVGISTDNGMQSTQAQIIKHFSEEIEGIVSSRRVNETKGIFARLFNSSGSTTRH